MKRLGQHTGSTYETALFTWGSALCNKQMFSFLNPVSVVTETELTLWAISWRQWSGEWDQGAPRSPAWKQRGEPRSEDVESWIPVSSFKLILGQFRLQEAIVDSLPVEIQRS